MSDDKAKTSRCVGKRAKSDNERKERHLWNCYFRPSNLTLPIPLSMDGRTDRGASLGKRRWKTNITCQAFSICQVFSYTSFTLCSIMDEETEALEVKLPKVRQHETEARVGPNSARPLASPMLRIAYLNHSSHNLPGFLVEPLSIPAGIQALELCGQPVVLPQKECVHGGELGHLTGARVPLGWKSLLRLPFQKGLASSKLPPLKYLLPSPPIFAHHVQIIPPLPRFPGPPQ